MAGTADREGALALLLQHDLPNLHFVDSATDMVVTGGTGKSLYVVASRGGGAEAPAKMVYAGTVLDSLSVPGFGLRYQFVSFDEQQLKKLGGLPEILPAHPDEARLGDYLELIGYDTPAEVMSGGQLRVTMHWRVLARPPQDLNTSTST